MRMHDKSVEVLYLSYDGLTDTLGQSQILPYLSGLARNGFRITLVSFEKADRFNQYGAQLDEICRKDSIEWRPLKYHKWPLVISTVYDLFILRQTISRILGEKSISIIHCRSYLVALFGLWAKRRFGTRFLFDMRGFWIEERFDGGIWRRDNLIHNLMFRFFKLKERQFIQYADHIVALTGSARAEIATWRISDVPVSVIPTCVDMAHFDPARITNSEIGIIRDRLSILHTDYVLVYSGSWGSWYMTDDILDFFSVLFRYKPESRLLILTPDKPDLAGYPLASKVIVRNISRKEMPAHLAIANAAVCFIKPTFSKKASSATKIAEAWSMNLPVVTNDGWGDINKLFEEGMPLFLCHSKSEYHGTAVSLVHSKPRVVRDKLVGSFDLSSAIEKYKGIYRRLA